MTENDVQLREPPTPCWTVRHLEGCGVLGQRDKYWAESLKYQDSEFLENYYDSIKEFTP